MFPRESPHLLALKLLWAALAVWLILSMCPPQWGPHIVAYGLVALIALFVLALGSMLVAVGRVHYQNWKQPQRTTPAILVRKWTKSEGDRSPAMRGASIVASALARLLRSIGGGSSAIAADADGVLWVSFRVGKRGLDLAVPEETYVGLDAGQTGMLSYRGEKFVSSEPMQGWEQGNGRLERAEWPMEPNDPGRGTE
jgi:hypothetical protein